MDKVFRVNMTDLTVKIENVPERWAGLGGRGLTSTIVSEEVVPTCHPLGENNKLVFAPGLLTGTSATTSGRMSAGAKSPLTGTIKENSAGGTAGKLIACMGIKALIIEGIPKKDTFYGLQVSKDGVTIAEESELLGQGNFAVIDAVMDRLDGKAGVISIGQAGEMKMASANISVKDPEGKIRSFGRGGLGAVMGSKRIKFISLDATGAAEVKIAEPDKFKTAARSFAKSLLDNEMTGQFLPAYGTDGNLAVINASGALPTKNFREGQYEGHKKICGETLHETIVQRGGKYKHGCHSGCVIQCSQVYTDKDGGYVTSGVEYETIWGLGAHCLNDDLDAIALADSLMDDIGVDSIEMAVTMGVAMDAGILPFGDIEEVLRLLREEVAHGSALGRVLGGGAASVGRTYGLTRVPVVKGQSIPAYDPRPLKGIGITYATSPMGADHTAGYAVGHNIDGRVPGHSKEGQIALSREMQIATASLDSTGLCLFSSIPMEDPEVFALLVEMLNARHGIELRAEDVGELGKVVLKTERAFNQAAGFTNAADRLPEFFQESLPPLNGCWDFTGEEIDTFWDF